MTYLDKIKFLSKFLKFVCILFNFILYFNLEEAFLQLFLRRISMTTTKKVIFSIVAVVIIAALVVGIVLLTRTNNNASAIMECSVNPDVQFVLNSDNKVIGVNVLNADGETLVANADFEGKSAEEAAKLFVKLSTEAGYIKVDNTTGTRVEITIYGTDAESYEALKDRITERVNSYFDENGIIAGAVTTISEDLKTALTNLGVKASEVADATTEEILDLIETTTEELKDTSVTLRTNLMNVLDELKGKYESQMNNIQSILDDLKLQIENLNGDFKKAAEEQLAQYQAQFDEIKAQLDKEIADAIEDIKTRSEEILAQAKTQINSLIETGREVLNNHKEAFEKDKEAIQAQIEAFRATLTEQAA